MHILICDDDAVFAARVETLVRDFFARRGLQVECTVCHSGEETLARRDLDLYQVALLDVDLDTMNGISLGKQLRQCSPESEVFQQKTPTFPRFRTGNPLPKMNI